MTALRASSRSDKIVARTGMKRSDDTDMEARTARVKYVFLDIESYTKDRSVEAQTEIAAALNELVSASMDACGVTTEQAILIPTGDGMALAFLQHDPFDVHVLVALDLLRRIHERNAAIQDPMRRFEVRIGLNENVDNVVTDINKRTNVAGAGISTAQRIMDQADSGQILVSQAVYDTLYPRERYMRSFRQYNATVKHGHKLPLYQFVTPSPGLDTDTPSTFVAATTQELTRRIAYYMAHAIRNRDFLVNLHEDPMRESAGPVLLHMLACDSVGDLETPGHEKYSPKAYRAELNAPVEQQYAYYAQIDLAVIADLAQAIGERLEPWRQCFEPGESIFVSSEGRARLIAECPDIANEFGIRVL